MCLKDTINCWKTPEFVPGESERSFLGGDELSIPNPLARGEQFLRGDIDVTLNLATGCPEMRTQTPGLSGKATKKKNRYEPISSAKRNSGATNDLGIGGIECNDNSEMTEISGRMCWMISILMSQPSKECP